MQNELSILLFTLQVELAENMLKGSELNELVKNQSIICLRLGNNKIATVDELKVLVSQTHSFKVRTSPTFASFICLE